MKDRELALEEMLLKAGWADAHSVPLHGDASFRSYERLHKLDGRTAILMNAPPPQEDVAPFLDVAERLWDAGLSAPAILGVDRNAGFLLLEDFGEKQMGALLRQGAEWRPIYELATDTLIALHTAKPRLDGLPGWQRPELIDKACLFLDWWMPAATGASVADGVRADFLDAWNAAFDGAPHLPETLVLRDYFPENLMLLDGREGVVACGLLDFQDAGVGSPTYDLVSLLRDARRDVPVDLQQAMLDRYLAARPEIAAKDFHADYALHGAQRCCRILGVFVRLDRRDGKPQYLKHLSRLWHQLDLALAAPGLAPVAEWFARYVPVALRGKV